MRHIALKQLLARIAATTEGRKLLRRLRGAHTKVARKPLNKRKKCIGVNGLKKWSPVKRELLSFAGNKCWYTEIELIGAPLAIDHYRPIDDYWFLAFDAENYRVACPFANSPAHNLLHGCAGGKGKQFPLLGSGARATGKNKLRREQPIILDPCNPKDCELIVFQADGRPVLSPNFSGNIVATERVDRSKLLLNLDHPDFNTKREQLYHAIADDVKTFEDLPIGSPMKDTIRQRMETRLGATAPFSTAARQYLQLHRQHGWVKQVLLTV